ncbi:MAG: hypothetical protein Q9217_000473 [Psora testacea]
MSLLQYIGKLYSLDTLDTRFTSFKTPPTSIDPGRGPPRADRSDGNGSQKQLNGASPPRWRTVEFAVYGLVFLVVVPWMFYTVYDLSQPWNPDFSKFEPLLSPGWIPGRKVDNSDSQYASFRNNVPSLFLVMALQHFLRRLFDTTFPASRMASNRAYEVMPNGPGSPLDPEYLKADIRLNQRITFDFIFGLLFLVALHGFSAPKVLVILYVNYVLATKLKRQYVPTATWVFNIGILFANELAQGYPYATIANSLPPWGLSGDEKSTHWSSYLDKYGGLIPRWEILFNVTVLRLISFNFDYIWSRNMSSNSSPLEKKQLDPTNLSERDRVDLPAKAQDYSFRNYLAYALYSPLYLAGPILTFNDYVSQQRYKPKSISWNRTIFYGIRFLLALLAMEVMVHFIYVVAISKAQPAWEIYTPFQLSMLGYFNLHHIWLKLLLPWRFFRLWALTDGVDPPENVVRCMSDNYSAFGFWRGWHRSFNRWIIRYIYIPLGGSGGPATRGRWGALRGVVNLFVAFSFVAMWHDIQLRLLVWGWLISLFVLPEVVAAFLFPKQKWQNRKEAYRVICGVGGVGNILMMMAANLVGFAVGLDGLQGLVFLAAACGALFTGVQVMFELRQQELRQGINMKC